MRIPGALLLSIAALAQTAPARAQSLADLARQEQERRKEDTRTPKVYSNKDLKPVVPSGAAATPAEPAAGAAEPTAVPRAEDAKAASQDTPAKAPVKDQAYWRKRLADSREQLERDRTLVEALQSRINALTTDFVNRDDPAQQAQLAAERTKAVNELARLKKAVDADVKAITAVEEEARRAGVPPGWLR